MTVAPQLGCDACGSGEAARSSSESEDSASPPCVPLLVSPPSGGDRSEAVSALFIITKLRFGSEDEGLNLDCVESPSGCDSELCRSAPEDGNEGIDNRLGPLANRLSKISGTDLQREMTRAVESGRHPLLLHVKGASSWRDGSAESVEVSFGLDADDDHSDLHSGRGKVRPDPESPSRGASRFSPVSIESGTLRAGPTSDWMPLFWTRGQIAAVPVHSAYLQLQVTKAPEDDPPINGEIQSGLIAGSLYPGDLSQAILEMDARTAKVLRRLGPIVRALVRQQSDLDLVPPGETDQRCDEDGDCPAGQHCRDDHCFEGEEHLDTISFSILFEAVSAIE